MAAGSGAAEDAAPGPVPTVRPGQLVAWAAPGTERCRLGERSFEPIGDTCWYPVDLLQGEGSLTAARRRAGRWEERPVRVGAYPYPEQRLQVEERHVDLSPADQARVEKEQRRVAALWGRTGPRRFALPLAPPLSPLPSGGRFGARRVFNGQPRSPHSGADYAVSAGTPVHAVAAGTVALAEEHFFSGKSVFLDHGDQLISMYFHLSELAVETGQEVTAGQLLGQVGATGRATGPHLHFGVRWHGARIDPALLFEPAGAVRLESGEGVR
jgi:murein DD-endopeptidase MepM/ murein hydrolase activator NlpD